MIPLRIASMALLTMIFLSPICQGLFYPHQYFGALVLTGVICLILSRENDFIKGIRHPISFILLLLIVVYLLACLFAVNKYLAIQEMAKWLMAWMFFLIGSFFAHRDNSRQLLHVLFFSGVTTSLIGLTASIGLIDLAGNSQGLRLQSTFQYANVLASYLLVSLLLGSVLWNKQLGLGKKIFMCMGYFIVLIALLLTGSRTVLIIGFFSIIVVLIIFRGSYSHVKKFSIILGAVGLCFGILILIPGLLRVSITELQARAAYYIDALDIIRHHWLLGIGGSNWDSRQFSYQSTLYYVRYIHSHPLQVAVDAGIMALFAYTALWLGYFKLAFLESKKENLNNYQGIIILACLTIFLHSMVDIDLSYPTILNLVALLMGLSTRSWLMHKENPYRWLRKVFRIAVLFIILSSGMAFISECKINQGADQLVQGNYQKAIENFESAEALNPWNGEGAFLLGKTYEQLGQISLKKIDFQLADKYYQRAVSVDKMSPKYTGQLAYLQFRRQQFDQSVKSFSRLVELQPLKIISYENLALALFLAGENLENDREGEKALLYYRQVAEIPKMIYAAQEKTSKLNFLKRQVPKDLIVNDRIKDVIAKTRKAEKK